MYVDFTLKLYIVRTLLMFTVHVRLWYAMIMPFVKEVAFACL